MGRKKTTAVATAPVNPLLDPNFVGECNERLLRWQRTSPDDPTVIREALELWLSQRAMRKARIHLWNEKSQYKDEEINRGIIAWERYEECYKEAKTVVTIFAKDHDVEIERDEVTDEVFESTQRLLWAELRKLAASNSENLRLVESPISGVDSAKEDILAAFHQDPSLREEKPNEVIRRVGITRTVGLDALRSIESDGGYQQFTRRQRRSVS